MELLEAGSKWVKENCDCQGAQEGNLTPEEQRGLKSLKRRIKEGEIVVLPTDKSGRFAIMSMETYVKAGMVHVKDDIEVGVTEKQANKSMEQ